jgi:hypothetical protein
MSNTNTYLTSGLPGLDRVLKGLIAGDNIVWRMDAIEDYLFFVKPFCEAARKKGRKLVYFRFASHEPLVSADFGAEIHVLHPEDGFENFIAEVHRIIEEAGHGAYYVFDCLSDLLVDWYSDQMLGNFFMLTCPYLYDLETVTYFGLLRNEHSSHATNPILKTTQLFLDIYRHNDLIYVRPLKVQHRYSPTMDMLHVWDHDNFVPVTASAVISEIQTQSWAGLDSDITQGSWERTFIRGREVAEGEPCSCSDSSDELYHRLIRMIISRDEGMLTLLCRYLKLQDILDVRKRLVGTGLIGGKTIGMLLARAIVRNQNPELANTLEPHDSFYIGSDVFYTFLVRNGVWWMRQKQRNPETFMDDAGLARQRILAGAFPSYIMKQFEEMLEYFGQSPIIVRSSSLLEDNFGNSFAGKYVSVFCANQGPKERRLEDFLAAVRTIYASTMSEEALRYRERRGLLDSDEQMALLVMRVSGAKYGNNFFPQAAGVGFSFNPYAWSEYIDPSAGVLRLVFGLGTRAVDRSDDDYTRIVALNAPQRRPESNFDEVRQYAQRRVDYLDLTANQLVSSYFPDVIAESPGVPVEIFADIDERDTGLDTHTNRVLTFNNLLSNTDFVRDMREILKALEGAYSSPVDIEFTVNFFTPGKYNINLVQCRPMPAISGDTTYEPAPNVDDEHKIVEAHGAVIGHSRLEKVSRIIYIVPAIYGQLVERDRYAIAKLIGQINRDTPPKEDGSIVLLGPGRWGTSTPALGIPLSFNDIKTISVLCEIVTMHGSLVPDASLGTHFLNELVEMDILYMALYPGKGKNLLDSQILENAPNRLEELIPDAAKWGYVVRVIDAADLKTSDDETIMLSADAQNQAVICYRSK